MCASITHRGPSSRGAFLEDGVGLGIQRLAIIDLDTGDQPIFNEDDSVVVVLNGEIYNYVELREELEGAGHRFRTRTDTEVIVHLYEDLGDACVERLRGMFAFALWDRRRRRLLLARDRLGKKPLFYAERSGTLWFGSEAKAILRDEEVPREADYGAIDSFLHFGYVPDPHSAFAALRKLPPAHTLSWDGERAALRRYWKLSYRTRLDGLSEPDMQDLIREQLLEATRLRLRSDVPLGAFLSGGVDSTAVVAAMAKQSSAPVRTFSIGFDVKSHDETRYAAEVAGLFGTEHESFTVEPHAIDVLPALVWHYGEPFADASAIPTYYLSQMTSRHVTVALNGDGGDESFAGYSRYAFHDMVRRFEWVPRRAAGTAAGVLERRISARTRLRSARQLLWLAQALRVPVAARYAATMAHVPPADRISLYTDDLRHRLLRESTEPPEALIARILEESDADNLVERLLDVDARTYLPGDLLVKVDVASMAHSLEVRSPLLDHEFVQTMAALPVSSKLRGGTGKRLFKDALRPWVPDHILDRRKMGFSPPMAAWLRTDLRGLPAEVLLDPAALDRGLFSESALRALIDGHLSGVEDNSKTLWALIQLELWFRTYIDSAVPAQVGALVA